ncbi:MAG TPA: hypothetical protein G4O11_00830 [Anaerolineae bacterium]|nr:hypothetical protein [Anaerolineae bacterium]
MKSLFQLVALAIVISAFTGVAYAGDHRLFERTADYGVQKILSKASVLSPVLESNGYQLVYLIVRDQNLNPVEGAASLLTVHFHNDVQTWLMPLTDEFGISQLSLEIKNQPPGSNVVLEFQVALDELQTTTRDSFRIWW